MPSVAGAPGVGARLARARPGLIDTGLMGGPARGPVAVGGKEVAMGRTMGTGKGPGRTAAFPLVASFLLLLASAAADSAPVRGGACALLL